MGFWIILGIDLFEIFLKSDSKVFLEWNVIFGNYEQSKFSWGRPVKVHRPLPSIIKLRVNSPIEISCSLPSIPSKIWSPSSVDQSTVT